MTHCKKCDGLEFHSISELRKHQWSAHREQYAKVTTSTARQAQLKKWREQSKARRDKAKALVVNARQVVEAHRRGKNGYRAPMLATDLLAQLQTQQKFVNDVVSLISGMIAQHEGNK